MNEHPKPLDREYPDIYYTAENVWKRLTQQAREADDKAFSFCHALRSFRHASSEDERETALAMIELLLAKIQNYPTSVQ